MGHAAEAGLADGDPKIDLYAWFGKDKDYGGVVGMAYLGGACRDESKTSFNEWRKSATANAYVRLTNTNFLIFNFINSK